MAAYYIAASGGTGTAGTSPATAWAFSKFQSFAFSAGDFIYFNKGDTFTGTTTFTHSGTAGNPITFDLFGNATNNAVLDGAGASSVVLNISANYIVVNNLVIQNNTDPNGIIGMTSGVHDITIYNCYINNGMRGIYPQFCGTGGVANIVISGCYFTNISDNSGKTNGAGSHIQFFHVYGSGVEIAGNKCFTDMTLPENQRLGVGDIINLYKSSGTSASWMLVHDNQVRGGGSNQGGFAGLILGDVGGQYQRGWNNIFIQSGAEGCQVQGGTNITMDNNKMYSPTYDYCFEGIGFGNYSGAPCTGITISGNVMNWRNKNGSVLNYYQDNSGNSTATGVSGGTPLSVDWSTNTTQYTADTSVNDTTLPNPLWTGSPWNTSSSVSPPVISYSPSTNNYTVGVTISSLTPNNTGGSPTGYTISPSLPSGLTFNTSTGVISGTPAVVSTSTLYTVTASNSGGSGSVGVTISVSSSSAYIIFSGRRIAFR